MEGIRTIGMSVCAVTVITSLFSMIAPTKKLDNVLRFSISLFFLTGLISPFINQSISFDGIGFYLQAEESQSQENGGMSADLADGVLKISQARLEGELEKVLVKENFSNPDVKITLAVNHIGSEKSISIKQLMVLIDKQDEEKAGLVASLFKGQVDISPEVFIKEE